MNIKRQIKRFTIVKPYRKAKNSEKLQHSFGDHVNVNEDETLIKLYGKDFKLSDVDYRVVQCMRYKHHLAYKVYDKRACYYKIYSPFFDELIEYKN
jgi:hypothetical protein